jgi:hypothetical protein
MRKHADYSCVFRLVDLGLLVVEHGEGRNEFTIVRPASVPGSAYRGWEESTIGVAGARISTNAPPATLQPSKRGWVVDISIPAAPGPGPVWFHSQFATAEEAVSAVESCYFGQLVDNNNPSLLSWYGNSGS